ncbi:MAG: hypothetical protein JOY92_06680, partial [Verrucomicrobia bacterium]|nr:hypothetical protein [Verrucomicrobiota bacterium]
YVFSHPEQPFSYRLLAKLHKLEPPKRFELTAAPAGEFLGPERLLERYGAMSQSELTDSSDRFQRSFLRNYDHQTYKVPYLIGKFTVLDAYPLTGSKYFSSGMAVVAQSVDVPNIFIEHMFPADKAHVASMQRILATGLIMEFRRSYDLSAIVHIGSLGDGRLLFTCVPLLYGPYGTTQNGAGFQLDPPKELNVQAGLPTVNVVQIENAERKLAEYRRATGTRVAAAAETPEKAPKSLTGTPELALAGGTQASGSTTQAPPNGGPGTAQPNALPPAPEAPPALVRIARALPVNPPPAPATMASPPRATLVKAAPVAAIPSPAVAAAVPVAQPVLTTSPPPDTTGRVGTWPTYRPGQMPRGRLLDVQQTSELVERGLGTEPMYLRGDFSVTAARENRAVLRPRQSLAERMLGRGNARIIVEYPRGLSAPAEGESFQRDAERPFQVVDVRRGADGQVNIYVREVTTAE